MDNLLIRLKSRVLQIEFRGYTNRSDVFSNHQLVTPKFSSGPLNDDTRTLSILESSFEGEIVTSIPYVENLIKEVEEVMEGKREKVEWSGMDGIYSVEVLKEKCVLADMDFIGELPTTEIYLLLKDWLEFLKEYYKRSFVPLEWIKEEYLEEARKLQKPING